MTKPANFPAQKQRRLLRMGMPSQPGSYTGIQSRKSEPQIDVMLLGDKTKKTPASVWSVGRAERRKGRIYR